MLNHGAFVPGFTGAQQERALAGARRLGYELYVSSAQLVAASPSDPLCVTLSVRNCGVAPFYYDWPLLLRALDSNNLPIRTWTTAWKLSSLLPAATNVVLSHAQFDHGLAKGTYTLLLGAPNPLTNGAPLRFANQQQDSVVAGWLTLGQFTVLSGGTQPVLHASLSSAGFNLQVSNAAPGVWTIEQTSSFAAWRPFATTNTVTTEWTISDALSSPARFYRVLGPAGGLLNEVAPAGARHEIPVAIHVDNDVVSGGTPASAGRCSERLLPAEAGVPQREQLQVPRQSSATD
jgi:hypothetical protein